MDLLDDICCMRVAEKEVIFLPRPPFRKETIGLVWLIV